MHFRNGSKSLTGFLQFMNGPEIVKRPAEEAGPGSFAERTGILLESVGRALRGSRALMTKQPADNPKDSGARPDFCGHIEETLGPLFDQLLIPDVIVYEWPI
jgi:hypothetical protein